MTASPKRIRVMARSQKLGHCICDPRKPCPCDLFIERDVCLCAGERLPEEDKAGESVALTQLVKNAGCASKIPAKDLARILARLPAVEDPVPVFFPVWEDPWMAPGRGTFVADLLRRGGARSIAESLGDGWPACDPAFVEREDPAAILLPSEPHPYGEEDRRRWLGRADLRASRKGHVYLIDGERTNRPGPRMAEGAAAVASIADRVRRGTRE